jgi:putative sterol carrier protein
MLDCFSYCGLNERLSTNRVREAISMYRSGNILARSIHWNACSWRPHEVFDSTRQSFQAQKAKGVHARYQWELSGPNGGQWWIDVNDGKYKMGKGKISNPSVTFVARDKDWVAVSTGKLGGTWAYMTGRLKIRGDQGLARKLGEIFP